MPRLEPASPHCEPYTAEVRSEADVRAAFAAMWSSLEGLFDAPGDYRPHRWDPPASKDAVRDLLVSDELTASYISVIPVRRDVGRDAAGPSLSRRDVPEELARPAARKVFGPLIEAQIRGGFAGGGLDRRGRAPRGGDLGGRPVHEGESAGAHRISRPLVLRQPGARRVLVRTSGAGGPTTPRDAGSGFLGEGDGRRSGSSARCQSFWIQAGAALSCELSDPPRRTGGCAPPVDPGPGAEPRTVRWGPRSTWPSNRDRLAGRGPRSGGAGRFLGRTGAAPAWSGPAPPGRHGDDIPGGREDAPTA